MGMSYPKNRGRSDISTLCANRFKSFTLSSPDSTSPLITTFDLLLFMPNGSKAYNTEYAKSVA
jgi:hypothetical protein